MKIVTVLSTVILSAGLAQAGMYVNAGGTSPAAGEGPLGTDANYFAYGTPHENATSGQVTTNSGVSFAEGGLGGTYDVGVGLTWLDATADQTKQSFNRNNDGGYDVFWQTWVGIDNRTGNGGIGGGDRLMLSLTGLEPNQDFTFTSYNFDTQDQAGSFTVDQTPSASETAVSPFDFPRANGVAGFTPWIDNAYSFDVTSDALGNLDITYAQNSGTWIGINGFDLVAVPEPGTLGLVAVFGGGVLFIRRRFMM